MPTDSVSVPESVDKKVIKRPRKSKPKADLPKTKSKKELNQVEKSPRKFEMRGKPRLSKARVMNLAESPVNSADEDEESTQDKNDQEPVQNDQVAPSNSESLKDANLSQPDEGKKANPILSQMLGPRSSNSPHTGDERNKPSNPISMNPDQLRMISPPMNLTPSVQASMSTPSPQVRPNMLTNPSPSKPSPLSQLTAFASKGLQSIAAHPSANSNYPDNYHPSHRPSPLVHSSPGDKDDSDYSIMSLDAYGQNQRHLKPVISNEFTPPSSTEPSHLLNLESNQYHGNRPRLPGMEPIRGVSDSHLHHVAKKVPQPGPLHPMRHPTPHSRLGAPPFPEHLSPQNYGVRQSFPGGPPQNYPPDPRAYYDPNLIRANHLPPPGAAVHQYRQRPGPMNYPPGGPGPEYFSGAPSFNPATYPYPPHHGPPHHNAPIRPGQSNMQPSLIPRSSAAQAHSRERPPPGYPPGYTHPMSLPPHGYQGGPMPPYYLHSPEQIPNGFTIQNLLHPSIQNPSLLQARPNGHPPNLPPNMQGLPLPRPPIGRVPSVTTPSSGVPTSASSQIRVTASSDRS